MASLGLRFAAMDFGLTSNGDLIFFEANPRGSRGLCVVVDDDHLILSNEADVSPPGKSVAPASR